MLRFLKARTGMILLRALVTFAIPPLVLAHEAHRAWSPAATASSEESAFLRGERRRDDQAVKVPDLSSSGYGLMGGRLVATAHGPAAMFMYDDDHGQRLVILTRPMQTDQNKPMTPHVGDGVSGFASADDGMGYGLVGQAAAEQLKAIADDVRRQMRPV